MKILVVENIKQRIILYKYKRVTVKTVMSEKCTKDM